MIDPGGLHPLIAAVHHAFGDHRFLGWTQRKQTYFYVRVPGARVEMEPPGDIELLPRQGSLDLTAVDVPVIGSSLAAILTALLDRGHDALVATSTPADAAP